jgi:hypothetical protein
LQDNWPLSEELISSTVELVRNLVGGESSVTHGRLDNGYGNGGQLLYTANNVHAAIFASHADNRKLNGARSRCEESEEKARHSVGCRSPSRRPTESQNIRVCHYGPVAQHVREEVNDLERTWLAVRPDCAGVGRPVAQVADEPIVADDPGFALYGYRPTKITVASEGQRRARARFRVEKHFYNAPILRPAEVSAEAIHGSFTRTFEACLHATIRAAERQRVTAKGHGSGR